MFETNIPPDTEFVVVQEYLDDGAKVSCGTILTAEEIGEQRAFVMEKKGWIARAAELLDPDDDEPATKPNKPPVVDASELVALGLSKSIIKALTAAGLTTRDAIAAYAAENDGLEKAGLGPKQEETVFEKLGGDVKDPEPNDGDKTEDDGAE